MTSTFERIKNLWIKHSKFRMLFFTLGIVICFFFYGVMQEKIMRTCYGGEFIEESCTGERFIFEMCLVFIYCTWNILVSRVLIMINNRLEIFHDAEKDKTKYFWYILCAVCNISAIVCSNRALRHINYPTQIIAKSCKPIPVMILGAIIAKKHYTFQRYIFILILVVGVVLFNYKEGNNQKGEHNTYMGLILVGISIFSGGALGGVEEKLRKTTKPRALQIMYNINIYSAILLLFGTIVTQEAVSFYYFINRYPEVIGKIGAGAFVSSCGQIFIYLMISNFGALPTSIATTTRKFFNVLVSIIFFGNNIIMRQWIAIGIVFAALFADTFFGKKELFKKKKNYKSQDVEKNPVELEELKKDVRDEKN